MERKNGWEIWNEEKKRRCMDFCEKYRRFISENKTERKFVKESVKIAEENGFRELSQFKKLKEGDKFYKVNKGKEVILGVMGKRKIIDGCKFIVSHIDTPRIDLKTSPLYEDENIALFKTYYYGGIKKYQWLTLPLALYGFVVLKNGKTKEIEIGDAPGEPVFVITDLLPHIAKKQMKKTIEEGFPGESLNAIVGSIPEKNEKKEKVKKKCFKDS